MQKKTVLRTQSPRKVSSAVPKSALIAKPKEPKQSARTKSALDDHSHRTRTTSTTSADVPLVSNGTSMYASVRDPFVRVVSLVQAASTLCATMSPNSPERTVSA
jgi:hypothetical protein